MIHGDLVQVQVFIPSGTSATLTVAIGVLQGTFTGYTSSGFVPFNSPNTFDLGAKTDQPLSTLVESAPTAISGLVAPIIPVVTDGEWCASYDGGITWTEWTSQSNVSITQAVTHVKVRRLSSGSYSTTVSATLAIGTRSDTFFITTIPLGGTTSTTTTTAAPTTSTTTTPPPGARSLAIRAGGQTLRYFDTPAGALRVRLEGGEVLRLALGDGEGPVRILTSKGPRTLQ